MSKYLLVSASLLIAASFLSPEVAVSAPSLPGQPAAQKDANQTPTEAASESTAPTAQAEASQPMTFIATGAPITVESLGINFTPPSGWDVEMNAGSLSLVVREPRDPRPSYDKPKYQRNITVAAFHRASPIDETRATELKAELTKQFSSDVTVSNFQIVEHKFFNYRGANDGLLVYSSLTVGEYPMMQMHVLVSGQAKQFLLTYTDLAERFSDVTQQAAFEKAWNAVVSIEVTGATPNRKDQYIRYGAFAGGAFLLLLVGLLIRSRAAHKRYESDMEDGPAFEGDVTGSMIATLAGQWRLGRGKDGDGEDADDMQFSTHAPKTRQTEYVSTF